MHKFTKTTVKTAIIRCKKVVKLDVLKTETRCSEMFMNTMKMRNIDVIRISVLMATITEIAVTT